MGHFKIKGIYREDTKDRLHITDLENQIYDYFSRTKKWLFGIKISDMDYSKEVTVSDAAIRNERVGFKFDRDDKIDIENIGKRK